MLRAEERDGAHLAHTGPSARGSPPRGAAPGVWAVGACELTGTQTTSSLRDTGPSPEQPVAVPELGVSSPAKPTCS